MASSGQKRKRQGEAIDGAIAFAEITKNAGIASPMLAPLSVVMETLVTLLQNAKVGMVEDNVRLVLMTTI
jgi:hypothetical protein